MKHTVRNLLVAFLVLLLVALTTVPALADSPGPDAAEWEVLNQVVEPVKANAPYELSFVVNSANSQLWATVDDNLTIAQLTDGTKLVVKPVSIDGESLPGFILTMPDGSNFQPGMAGVLTVQNGDDTLGAGAWPQAPQTEVSTAGGEVEVAEYATWSLPGCDKPYAQKNETLTCEGQVSHPGYVLRVAVDDILRVVQSDVGVSIQPVSGTGQTLPVFDLRREDDTPWPIGADVKVMTQNRDRSGGVEEHVGAFAQAGPAQEMAAPVAEVTQAAEPRVSEETALRELLNDILERLAALEQLAASVSQ